MDRERGPTLAQIEALAGLQTDLHQRDFLLTWERSMDELRAVLLVSEALAGLWRAGMSTQVFDGGLAVANFRDQSTRTRFSFASAASMLGLSLQELDEAKSQIAHGETVRETANMISFLAEAIGIRDDLFIGEGNRYMREVAAAVEEGYHEGILPQRPAVINLQCDLDHPTQTMADLLHLKRTFGSLDGLRGRRIAMTWAYSPSYGKPLSVPQGVIALMTRFGADVVLAHPEGYDLLPETLEQAHRFAGESGGSFRQVHRMADAFEGADVVYPKSWAPLSVMEQRTRLLRSGETGDLDALEKCCLQENARHRDWTCDRGMMSRTRDGQALYMHCLPADITGVSCDAGEVTAEVFEQYRLDTYREASWKPFVIAAMILLSRFADPAATLRRVIDRAQPRRVE
jgi:knotted carbamoyltransferase YgeW